MYIKIVDFALNGAFLAVHGLTRLRDHLLSKEPVTQDPAMAEWLAARERQAALQFDLENPTASRLYDHQAKLVRRAKIAGDKCYRLAVAMRVNRRA